MSAAADKVYDAAKAVVDGQHTRGTMARWKALDAALEELRRTDLVVDVAVAAALAADRYGRAGSPEYTRRLRDAVERAS